MFCVLQTEEYAQSVKRLGLSEGEAHAIVQKIAEDPTVGDLIPGTGGARKWRVPFGGKGKRGGGRVCLLYTSDAADE